MKRHPRSRQASHHRWCPVWCITLGILIAGGGCQPNECVESHGFADRLRLASTTSTENSGLFQALLPRFEERTGIHVDVIAVGTGRALRLAENGDVDAVLVHAPDAEEAFVEAGFGVNRRFVMTNQFILVGPRSDPAGIRGTTDAVQALRAIHEANARFVSRGDESGTHTKELGLWQAVGWTPTASDTYVETGQGMSPTLRIASEMGRYCLSDDATFYATGGDLELEILVTGDPALNNPYHVMAVNPARYPDTRYLEAMLFIGWLTSPEGAAVIRSFQVGGRGLFVPAL